MLGKDRNKTKSILDSVFMQKPKEYSIYAKNVVTLELLKDQVDMKDVVVKDDHFETTVAFNIVVNKDSIPFSLMHRAKVYFASNPKINTTDDVIVVTYTKGQKIMDLLPSTDDLKGTLKKVTGMLYNSGGQVTKAENVPVTLSSIPAYSDMDYLHLEVVAANMARDPDNDSKPWRLKQKGDPVIYGMKNIAYAENELVGLSFENAGKAITNGLVRGDIESSENIIEKEILLDF